MSEEKSVPCPRCGKPSPYTQKNKYRPFCGERCQLIDLGEWADEKYRVPDLENKSTHQVNEKSSDPHEEE